MKKRIVSAALALAMVMSLFTGCGNNTSQSGSNSGSAASTAGSPVTVSNSGSNEVIKSNFTDIEGNTVEIQTGVQFPLKEEVTLTFWYPVGWNYVGEMSALQEGEVWQFMKEQTNVNIEFIHPASGTETEAYSLLYAQDRLPDIIYSDLNKFE